MIKSQPKRTNKTTSNTVLFWRVPLHRVFIFDSVEYNKFSARQAVSAAGKMVTFKDSDTVKLKSI